MQATNIQANIEEEKIKTNKEQKKKLENRLSKQIQQNQQENSISNNKKIPRKESNSSNKDSQNFSSEKRLSKTDSKDLLNNTASKQLGISQFKIIQNQGKEHQEKIETQINQGIDQQNKNDEENINQQQQKVQQLSGEQQRLFNEVDGLKSMDQQKQKEEDQSNGNAVTQLQPPNKANQGINLEELANANLQNNVKNQLINEDSKEQKVNQNQDPNIIKQQTKQNEVVNTNSQLNSLGSEYQNSQPMDQSSLATDENKSNGGTGKYFNKLKIRKIAFQAKVQKQLKEQQIERNEFENQYQQILQEYKDIPINEIQIVATERSNKTDQEDKINNHLQQEIIQKKNQVEPIKKFKITTIMSLLKIFPNRALVKYINNSLDINQDIQKQENKPEHRKYFSQTSTPVKYNSQQDVEKMYQIQCPKLQYIQSIADKFRREKNKSQYQHRSSSSSKHMNQISGQALSKNDSNIYQNNFAYKDIKQEIKPKSSQLNKKKKAINGSLQLNLRQLKLKTQLNPYIIMKDQFNSVKSRISQPKTAFSIKIPQDLVIKPFTANPSSESRLFLHSSQSMRGINLKIN